METDNNTAEAEATSVKAKSIKAIDKTTVHKICSGQVVLTLATAVKELVENSIDAGATYVEIRLKEQGSSLIEVSDNGKGVQPCDFEGLTLKHHTSKLQDFGDLIGVQTFGFRGEALSSLCALSSLSIVTRHQNQNVGTKLVYNSCGKLIEKTPLSRQVGTTVMLQNLFHTLPVRHKEFLRNLKKEFNKMVQVLYAYCLVTTHIRIVCTNQSGKNSKTNVVSTESNSSLKENILSIFGHKQVSSLLEIKQRAPSAAILSEYDIKNQNGQEDFSLEGFVSSCTHGQGRSCADRQFFFINSRPCDPTKVVRVVNEVYRHYNRHQFPMVVLKMHLSHSDIDVNVTPDKRQVFVSKEKLLLATIKTTLISLFENVPSSFSVQNSPLFSYSEKKPDNSSKTPKASLTPKILSLVEKFSRTPSVTNGVNGSDRSIKRVLSPQEESQLASKQLKLQDSSFITRDCGIHSEKCDVTQESYRFEDQSPMNFDSTKDLVANIQTGIISEAKNGIAHAASNAVFSEAKNEANVSFYEKTILKSQGELIYTPLNDVDLASTPSADLTKSCITPRQSKFSELYDTSDKRIALFNESTPKVPRCSTKDFHSKTEAFLQSLKKRKTTCTPLRNKTVYKSENQSEITVCKSENQSEVTFIQDSLEHAFVKWDSNCNLKSPVNVDKEYKFLHGPVVLFDDETSPVKCLQSSSFTSNSIQPVMNRKSLKVPFSMDKTRQKHASRKTWSQTGSQDIYRKFRAKIAPTDNASAEEELQKQISKGDFQNMKLIGQFNLGFIITRLHSDLFIIDQHATDEKYNFEDLQKTCVLQNQKLIIPQVMELTPANEGILLDNLDIFIKNGFDFKIDEGKETGRKVSMTSMPHSRGWELKKDDIEEMIFMLEDNPGVMCRPSKVSSMFASRACRKSVMVGTPLNHGQMRKLIHHMGDMDQPWNCPHGRPTIRHLVNLSLLKKLD